MEDHIVNYSIIIPHYNTPNLLIRCLSTIPIRKDIQVIVVDDQSEGSDNYKALYPELSRPYLEFYSTPKGGSAGRARNIGLQHAKGEWLIFADADDFFNYCFPDLLDKYAHNSEDVIFFNACSLDTNDYTNTNRSSYVNQWISEYSINKIEIEFKLRYLFGEPWGKFVKASLVKEYNIKFQETRIHNDTQFAYQVGYYSKNICVDQHAIYCITDRSQSVSKRNTVDCLLTKVDVFSKKYHWLRDKGVHYQFEEQIMVALKTFYDNHDKTHYNKCLNIMEGNGIDMHKEGKVLIENIRREPFLYKQRVAIVLFVSRILRISVHL